MRDTHIYSDARRINNRAPLLYYIKHWASFQSHQWIQTRIIVRKCSIRVKIVYLFCVTLKFGGWPWKSIGHLSYSTSIFEHHFKEYKLEWRSRNVQFGSKSAIFWPRDLEIWRMTLINNRGLFHTTSSIVRHFKAIGEFKLGLQSGNVQLKSKSVIFCPVWPWNLTYDLQKQ